MKPLPVAWTPVRALGLVGLAAWAAARAAAAEFEIPHTRTAGELVFAPSPTAVYYRVECAVAAGGPWTNASAVAALDAVQPTGTGEVTVALPAFYRVIAVVTGAPGAAPSGMVIIPAGSNAGINPLADGERPSTTYYPATYSLTLSAPLYMDRYPVTKALWDEVAGWALANGYDIGPSSAQGKASDHPAQTVTWYEAAKWCNARSEREGLGVCYKLSGLPYRTGTSSSITRDYNATGYRMPKNDEWEYAARGGGVSRRFPWGDAITPLQANYHSLGPRSRVRPCSYDLSGSTGFPRHPGQAIVPSTSPVGSYPPNAYGLCDIVGNVWQWCDIPSQVRGGCWNSAALALRCGSRWSESLPTVQAADIGFRCVRRVTP